MVELSPGPIITLFVVSVTVMVFFTTSATNRIEKMENPNRQFVTTIALVMSFCSLFLLAWLLVVSQQLSSYPAIYKSLKFVFAAFIIPGFVLMWDQVDKLDEYTNDPEFSRLWTALGIIFLAFTYLAIIFASPVSG